MSAHHVDIVQMHMLIVVFLAIVVSQIREWKEIGNRRLVDYVTFVWCFEYIGSMAVEV